MCSLLGNDSAHSKVGGKSKHRSHDDISCDTKATQGDLTTSSEIQTLATTVTRLDTDMMLAKANQNVEILANELSQASHDMIEALAKFAGAEISLCLRETLSNEFSQASYDIVETVT